MVSYNAIITFYFSIIPGCSGHEVAISIDSLIHSLDLKEETLATMLCYLESHGWIEVLNPINDTCCLKCYGGSGQLKALTKRVPAVNVGVNIERNKGEETICKRG